MSLKKNKKQLRYLAARGLKGTEKRLKIEFRGADLVWRFMIDGEPVMDEAFIGDTDQKEAVEYERIRLLGDDHKGPPTTQRKGTGAHWYLPEPSKVFRKEYGRWRDIFQGTDIPIIVSESEAKAAALSKYAYAPSVGMCGAQVLLTPELDLFEWEGRAVELMPDSDAMDNIDVKRGAIRLGDELTRRGAVVSIGILPTLANQDKTGPDDYCMSPGGREELRLPPSERTTVISHTWSSPLVTRWRAEVGAASDGPIDDSDIHVTDDWLDVELPELDQVVHHMIARGTVTLLAAEGGAGKSFLILQLILCVALGLPFFGYSTKQCRVLYFSAEDPKSVVRRRLRKRFKALGRLHKWKKKQRAEMWQLIKANVKVKDLVGEDVSLIRMKGASVVRTGFSDRIKDVVMKHETAVVILDPLSRLHNCNENDNTVGTMLVNTLENVCRAAIHEDGMPQYTVILLHHISKAATKSKDESAEASRGGGAIVAAARSVFRLIPDPKGSDKIKPDEDEDYADASNILKLVHAKSNYTPKIDPIWVKRDEDGFFVKFNPEFETGDSKYSGMTDRFRKWCAKHKPKYVTERQLRDNAHAMLGKGTGDAGAKKWLVTAIANGVLRESTTIKLPKGIAYEIL